MMRLLCVLFVSLLGPSLSAQRFLPSEPPAKEELVADSIRRAFNIHAYSYTEKFALVSNFQAPGLKVSDVRMDTLAQSLELEISFHFPKRLWRSMARELKTDTSLKKMPPGKRCLGPKGFILGRTQLRWDSAYKMFVAKDSLPVCAIGGESVHKFIPGCLAMTSRSGGNSLHIYLQGGRQWYYFYYVNGVMLAVSSDEAFNNTIARTPDFRKRLKGVNGKSYRYALGNPQDKGIFVKRMQRWNESASYREKR